MPLTAGRRFEIDTKRTTMNPQSNRRGSNEELVVAEIGQVGTQFDGFAHQTIGNSLYNCFKVDEVSTRTGFTKLGIQNVGALVTRGVLIDVAALKNVDMLADTYEITVQDLQQALARQKRGAAGRATPSSSTPDGASCGGRTTRVTRGGNPGIGVAAAEWLARQNPMLRRRRHGAGRSLPNPDPQVSLPIHQIMLVVNGIHLLENLKLDELAAKRVYEFAFIVEPLKIRAGPDRRSRR